MAKVEPIAIIGMSFKFPGGAETSEEFWKLLVEKRNVASKVPEDRFNIDGFWHPDSTRQGIINAREAHMLAKDPRSFDAGFFSMAPREVNSMDPQHRGLMETTYHAFESAGLRMMDVSGSKTSVHVGCFTSDFASMQLRDTPNIPKYNSLGTAGSILANRISWFYNLHGQSMFIDTACSSSMVAMALGCQGLTSGEADVAVVGGSNLILTPEPGISLSNMSMLSPSGRCYSFDARGDGYGRGEGFAVLILKPLSKAIKDGNPVRAIVRSIGMNQDGHTSSGITQPSKEMQVRLIHETYRKAGIDMKHTRFFEAHGTGTPVGDPIEARAIGEAFFHSRSKDDPIYIGAVKSNVGHLEGSSGLAGVVKTVLALEKAVIPPNSNFEILNPRIDADFFNLRFPTECVPWPGSPDHIRRASVNSFGFGGSNCHVILEAAEGFFESLGHRMRSRLLHSQSNQQLLPTNSEDRQECRVSGKAMVNGTTFHGNSVNRGSVNEDAINGDAGVSRPADGPETNGLADGESATDGSTLDSDIQDTTEALEATIMDTRNGVEERWQSASRPKLLILSASDEDGILRQARNLRDMVDRARPSLHKNDILGDISFTLNTRRTMLDWKSYSVLTSMAGISDLETSVSAPFHRLREGTTRLGLVFTGQGAQWSKMGYELLGWPVFRASLERTQEILNRFGCTWGLTDELAAIGISSRLQDPELSQAITTAIQLALVDLLRCLDIEPHVVVGHSSGEIAAAYCAGFLSQESAMRVSFFRGLLASKLARESKSSPWGMASIGLPASEIPSAVEDLWIQNPHLSKAGTITVSCVNCPTNTTVSGPLPALDAFVDHLSSKQIFARKLKVDAGYHSAQMNVLSADYLRHLSNLRPGTSVSRTRMVSSVTPGLIGADIVCSGDYWVQNMISTVRFFEAVSICCQNTNEHDAPKSIDRSQSKNIFVEGFLEVGPHAALQGPLRETFETHKRQDLFYTSLLFRNKPADATVLDAIGYLFTRNVDIDLRTLAQADHSDPREPCTVIDLPEYPFNHSVVYQESSSMSRAFRSRKHGHHPLLGSQLPGWSPLDARWGLTIKKDETPWVSDHRLHGSMWYPAAGMIVMAIEALKQILPDDGFDFELKNISFTAPIIISEDSSGTDVQISMAPKSEAKGAQEIDYGFSISCRRSDHNWAEVCAGTIFPQRTRGAALDVNKQDEEEEKRKQLQAVYRHAVDTCQGTIEAHDMYPKIEEITGLKYGPSFQALTHVHYNSEGEAHAKLMHVDESISETSRPYTIHPSTLDCIFQLAIPTLSEGLTQPLPTLVPSHLTRLWISRHGAGFPASTHTSELVHVTANYLSKRTAESSTTVFSKSEDSDIMAVRVQVEQLETTEVARDAESEDQRQVARSFTHELVWKADIAHLDRDDMYKYCARYRGIGPEPTAWYKEVRLMLLGFVQKALGEMKVRGEQPLPSMEKYTAWLRNGLNKYLEESSNGPLPSGIDLQKLAVAFESGGHRGAFGVLVGRQLRQILTGEIDPLGTIFANQDDVADIYEELNRTGKAFPMLHGYLDTLVHKYPGLRFLEIGAGTGATTTMILDTIANIEQGPRYSEYVFTDISPYFFQAAKERFKSFDRVQYHILDIEHQDFDAQDIVAKGEGFYDVVVAANVLHATKDLHNTLRNVRRLLKSSGKLILVEMTTPHNIETGFVWGSLPGWWLGTETFRQESAVIEEDRWDLLLQQSGFNGTEQVFTDWDSETSHGWSVMVSSAMPDIKPMEQPTPSDSFKVILFVDDSPSDLQTQFAHCLKEQLSTSDISTDIETMTLGQALTLDNEDIANQHCILLADMGRSHLHDVKPYVFQCYQRLLITAKSVLWVQTRCDLQVSPPYFAMVEGLCRVVRSEHPFARIVTVVLESESPNSELLKKVLKVFKASILDSNLKVEVLEEEYREELGYLCINRLRQAKYLDQHMSSRIRNEVRLQSFGSGVPLKLGIQVPGLLDTLEWSEDVTAYDPLLPDEVEVQVQAIGVNFKDCLTLLGRVNSDTIGCECAGLVFRVGKNVSDFSIGDRVAVATMGAYRTLVRANQRSVVAVPESMALEDAAGVPVAFMTAYYSLHHVGRLQQTETVLIHAAAGGTGQAAVQIAQHIGAEIFATVGSEPKKIMLMERYGIPEDHIFYSRDTSFADGIRRMTNGKGVDVILNCLSGKLLVASWELIAEFGRFVEIGRKDIDTRGNLPMFPFKRNAIFAGVDLAAFVDNEKTNHLRILQQVFDMVKSGALRPSYPIQLFPVDQAAQAFRSLVSGKTTGKLVLVVDAEAVVPFRTNDDSGYRLSSNATYVVAGGLGGIGRQITRWLVRRGAANILILTRSGAKSDPKRSKMVMELERKGVNLNYGVCDITDLDSVRKAVESASKTMPPIRGCFQAAMVIQDRTFSAMSQDEWQASIRPKVQGSWNLHCALPSGMDFFVMLSSAISIFGNAGQANYAAGNTFQDALARQRVANGEKAVAIDLGMVLGEGFVAERKDVHQRVMQFDLVDPISLRDLFAMLDYYCNPAVKLDSPAASQIITGLQLPTLIHKAGREIPAVMRRPLFSAMHQVLPGMESTGTAAAVTNIAAIFEESETAEIAGAAVAEALKSKLCKILGLEVDSRTIHERMDSFGVDSLIALEIRNWMAKEMRADLALYEILGDVKLIDTGITAARKSDFRPARWM